MRSILSCVLTALVFTSPAFAQKIPNLLSDSWVGEVVSVNDATREVVIRSTVKGAAETFAGILEEGARVRVRDGDPRELKVSDIVPGTRIRVFYKTRKKDVGGRKVKVHSISTVVLLGADEYTPVREALNLEPSAPVASAESDALPAANPLKLYLAAESPFVRRRLAAWAGKWNKSRAEKYGSIELVPELAQSDIALVVYRGSEREVGQFPADFTDARGRLYRATHSHMTVYVVANAAGGPRVLWKRVVGNLNVGVVDVAAVEIEKEFEKMLKARAQGPKRDR